MAMTSIVNNRSMRMRLADYSNESKVRGDVGERDREVARAERPMRV